LQRVTHWLFSQLAVAFGPAVQALAQLPQCAGSDRVSTQALLHLMYGLLQEKPHAPEAQVGVPFG
jgi:hypothetical protein